MRWRIATFRSIVAVAAAFLIAVSVVAVQAALRFDGTCGGLIPFLSAAQPCTVWQYVWSNVSFTFAVFFEEYWLIALSTAGLVFIGAAIVERFWSRQNAA